MVKMPQVLVNVPLPIKINPVNEPAVKSAVKHVEDRLAGQGRVLLRASGTEPLIRVMVEGEDEKQVREYAQEIADAVSDSVAKAG